MNMTQPKLYARDNKLYISFTIEGEQIKKSLKLDDTKENRKLANTKLIPQLIIKANSGEFFNNKKTPTVDEFIKVSFDIHKHNRRELTQKNYKNIYKCRIKPYFENKKLNEIKPSYLSQWQNKLKDEKKLSSKSIKVARTILHTMFEDARKDEIIEKNPFDLVDNIKSDPPKEIIPFSISEIKNILSNVNEKMKAFFAIGFYTGMRLGEILALKWDNIDIDNGIIKVKHSIREGKETAPKTLSSIRDIEILDILKPYLIEHKTLVRDDSLYLFETYEKKPYASPAKIGVSYWKPLLKNLNIPYRIMYQMRHTFASMMISNGEDILWVSNMLGHKDSSTTLKKYAKYIKHEKKQRATFLLEQN